MQIKLFFVISLFFSNTFAANETCLGDITQTQNGLNDLLKSAMCRDTEDYDTCVENYGTESNFARNAALAMAGASVLAVTARAATGGKCGPKKGSVFFRLFPTANAESLPVDDICFLDPKDRVSKLQKEMRITLQAYDDAIKLEQARYAKLAPSAQGILRAAQTEKMLDEFESIFEKEVAEIRSGKLKPENSKFAPRATSWGGATNKLNEQAIRELRREIGETRIALRTLPPDQVDSFVKQQFFDPDSKNARFGGFLRNVNAGSREHFQKLFMNHWNDIRDDMVAFDDIDKKVAGNYKPDIRRLNAYAKKYPRLQEVVDLVDHRAQMEPIGNEITEALADLDKPIQAKTDDEAFTAMKKMVTDYDNLLESGGQARYEPKDATLYNRLVAGTRDLANTAGKGLQERTAEIRKSALLRNARDKAFRMAGSSIVKRGKSIVVKTATGVGTVMTVVDVASAANDVKNIAYEVTMDEDGDCLDNEYPDETKEQASACKELMTGIQNNQCKAVPAIEFLDTHFAKPLEDQMADLKKCPRYCEEMIKPLVQNIGSNKWLAKCEIENGKVTGAKLRSKNPEDRETLDVKFNSKGKIASSRYIKKNSGRIMGVEPDLHNSYIEYDEKGKPSFGEVWEKSRFSRALSSKVMEGSSRFSLEAYQQKLNWMMFDQVQGCCDLTSFADPKLCQKYGISRSANQGVPSSRRKGFD